MLRIFTFATATCLALAGCGGSSLPRETDEQKGRAAIATVLEAWKFGRTTDDVKNGSPSILARDPDWKAGCKLTAYEIAPENDRSGVDLLLTVKLSLTRPDGQSQEKKVKFAVGIGSSTVVFRQE